jgi:hypothetical protein
MLLPIAAAQLPGYEYGKHMARREIQQPGIKETAKSKQQNQACKDSAG